MVYHLYREEEEVEDQMEKTNLQEKCEYSLHSMLIFILWVIHG